MKTDEHSEDVRAIQALIARQFGSLSWSPAKSPDWAAFTADFYPDAALYPAARPAKRQTVEPCRADEGSGRKQVRSFDETVLGTEVRVNGNVAVALAACEVTENDPDVTRGVEALLLIDDAGQVADRVQAWNTESDINPMPPHLVDRNGSV